MGFLDTIGQRASQSPTQASRSPINQNPTNQNPTNQNATRNDASRLVQRAPAWTPPQNDRIHPAAIWCAVLFVVAAVAAAGWLAKRNAQPVEAAPAEAAVEAQPQKEKPVDRVSARPTSVRPQAAVRRGNGVVEESNGNERAGTASELSDIALDNQPANLAEAEVEPAIPSIVALPEDDTVYSSEGDGVIAPKLASLGFVRRLVSGLRVQTSTIELVISKSGTVERAKIFSTPHWEDALLLSRAKTFQFVPAYRNGYPVRYRFVMDVDTSP
jgi:hypothetical protein